MSITAEFNEAVRRVSRGELGEGVREMRQRRAEFSTELECTLAGIAAVPAARAELDDALDDIWRRAERRAPRKVREAGEVVIGGGPHGAIYALARVAAGEPAPTILERGRVGGAFAVSRDPSFWLNSRNRPGRSAPPNEVGGQNFLPGAPLQLAHMPGGKFHTNADMALAVRLAVARSGATVVRGEALGVTRNPKASAEGYRYLVRTSRGAALRANRVVDARGLGGPTLYAQQVCDGERVLTFPQLMARMDEPWPLRGLRRVAVVGGGDSAKCAVEALLGVGPESGSAVAALDWVERVDVYSELLPDNVEDWRATQRGRYQGIGSFLRFLDDGTARLRVLQTRGVVSASPGAALVNGRAYDAVVVAAGLFRPELELPAEALYEDVGLDLPLGKRLPDDEVYKVGPSAGRQLTGYELRTSTALREDFLVALFRLGDATASLASTLPTPAAPASLKRLAAGSLKEAGERRRTRRQARPPRVSVRANQVRIPPAEIPRLASVVIDDVSVGAEARVADLFGALTGSGRAPAEEAQRASVGPAVLETLDDDFPLSGLTGLESRG